MPLPSTMTPIATQTLTSNSASVTFSSLSQNYTDLMVVCSAAGTSTQDLIFRINGDTGTNYSVTWLYANGTSAGSSRNSNLAFGYADYYGTPSATVGNTNQILQFMNYSNTTINKTILSRSNSNDGANAGISAVVNTWRNTSAITSITLYMAGSVNLISGSSFTVYGIKAAS